MKCANKQVAGAIIAPACYGNEATQEVTVRYHKNFAGTGYASDSHYMCDECGQRLKADAESHGYEVVVRLLRGKSKAARSTR